MHTRVHHTHTLTHSAYLLQDVPRWTPALAQRIDALGGIKFMLLTHRDDVAGHVQWAERFKGATRIIHTLEVNKRQRTE
jgi:hypothetical protein